MKKILILALLVCLSGCNDDSYPPFKGSTDDVDQMADFENDIGYSDVFLTDISDSCVPTKVECSSQVCGEVDDGCGVVLCEPCECEHTTELCGSCDLGVRVDCRDDSATYCDMPAIPGLKDDQCEALVFVDIERGKAGAAGTRLAPL